MHLSHTAKCVEVPDFWLCFSVSEMPSRIQPANARDVRDMGSIPNCEDPLEEGTAIHSSILAWRVPWTEEPGWL